ncbi:MAG TPA: AAA family ATPase, partial [Bacillota bacterium]|nr:AAA family ATPase [Bacillota bacterium]
MISHVSIKDFAIIKDLSIDLYPGLNIITGETGSGKSIIIEAVSMALGSRADSDYIRSGADKATVTIIADGDATKLAPLLETYGVPSDMPMVLHREI